MVPSRTVRRFCYRPPGLVTAQWTSLKPLARKDKHGNTVLALVGACSVTRGDLLNV